MADLEDTFGKDFAEHVEQRTQERRQERQKLSDEAKKQIANKAINEGAFHEGDPQFEYVSENGITHNVLLMKLAEPREGSVWNMANRMDSGAISVPLDYLGQWIWSIFNDEEEARKLEEGEWYIVAGNLDTWEPDNGDPQDQFSPVRGVMSLDEARELADDAMEEGGFGSSDEDTDDAVPDSALGGEEEEQEEEDEDEDDSSSSKGGLFGSSEDDDDEEEEQEEEDEVTIDATASEVYNVVEELADEEPEVWDVTPDHDDWDTFILVVCDKLGLDPEDENVQSQVGEMAMDRVSEGPREQDTSDEDDSLF